MALVWIGGGEKEKRGKKRKEKHRSTCPKAQGVFLVALSFKTQLAPTVKGPNAQGLFLPPSLKSHSECLCVISLVDVSKREKMDENSEIIEAILRGDDHATNLNDHQSQDSGWKTVSYSKRRKNPPQNSLQPSLTPFHNSDVFLSVDQHSEDRLRRAQEAAATAAAAAAALQSAVRSKQHSDDDDSDAEIPAGAVDNGGAEVKKVKPKKPKKPKVSVGDAASKMDADDLSAFLLDISVSFNFEILWFDSVRYTLIRWFFMDLDYLY